MMHPHPSVVVAASLAAVAASGTAARAQDSAQASGAAAASVVAMISASQEDDLAFGALVVSSAEGGEVIVAAAGGVTRYTGSVRPACGAVVSCTSHPAQFAVTGQAGHSYQITLPQRVYATGNRTGHQLEVAGLIAHSNNRAEAGSGRIDDAGHDRFWVGGTLAVAAGTPTDAYSADLPVSVTYD